MRTVIIIFLFLLYSCKGICQDSLLRSPIPYKTALKININGVRMAVEQRLSKKITIQFEVGHLGKNTLTLNPQLRYYAITGESSFGFIGLGYLYKQDHYPFSDSFRITGTAIHGYKEMAISKYVHAVTINCGYYWKEKIFKRPVLFEFNPALGIRLKKSNRYGLNANEEIIWGEAYIIRPQREQDTNGKFKLYPEINLVLRAVIPLVK